MEFNEKLQELRKKKGLTQEELAKSLYVSRTAISKWESGRGYPSIESLKAIAAFFSVTVDELLSSEELLTLAEENQKRTKKQLQDVALGLSDLCMALLLFLPLFAVRAEEMIQSASLLALDGISLYLKIAYFAVVIGSTLWGVLTLALQAVETLGWTKCKTAISLALGLCAVLLFVASLQVYAAVFALVSVGIKVFVLIKEK